MLSISGSVIQIFFTNAMIEIENFLYGVGESFSLKYSKKNMIQ